MNVLRGRLVVLIAVLVLAQVLTQAVPLDRSSTRAVADAPSAARCGAQALVDPPLWEQSLPLAKVSPSMAATDPGCVREVGRSATGVMWRGPDQKLTGRLYSSPVNYQAADGSWQAIDTRLVASPNGGVVNRAGPFSARFGATASSSQLVNMTQDETSLSFAFDGALRTSSSMLPPASASTAVVSGSGSDTVTYSDALPGMDVRYQVLGDSLKEALVLNAPLATGVTPHFSFSVSMSGLKAQTADDGTVEFVSTSSGKVIYEIPAGTAFDSSGDMSQGILPARTPVSVQLIAGADPTLATVIVSVDSTWLADPARVYPVTIDPTTTDETTSSDAYINHATPNTPCDGSCQNAGYLGYIDPSGTPTASQPWNSLLAYPSLAGLTGYDITSATWNGYAVASLTSSATVTLNPISSAWTSSSVTWNTQPSVLSNTATVTYGSAPGWLSADITSWVQNWTATSGGWAQDGIELSGPSTTGSTVYFGAQEDPLAARSYLQITYDSAPTTARLTGGGRINPDYVSTTTPTLSAQINDTDTSSGLTGNFQLWSGATLVASGPGSTVYSGQNSTWPVPTALTPGTLYTWRVQGNDGSENGPWSAYEFLTALTTAPSLPTVSISGSSRWGGE